MENTLEKLYLNLCLHLNKKVGKSGIYTRSKNRSELAGGDLRSGAVPFVRCGQWGPVMFRGLGKLQQPVRGQAELVAHLMSNPVTSTCYFLGGSQAASRLPWYLIQKGACCVLGVWWAFFTKCLAVRTIPDTDYIWMALPHCSKYVCWTT